MQLYSYYKHGGLLLPLLLLFHFCFAQQVTIIGTTRVLVNEQHSYQLPVSGATNIDWSLNGGGTIIRYGVQKRTATVQWTQVGTYTLSASYTSETGMFTGTSLQITVVPPVSGGQIAAGKSPVIQNEDFSELKNTSSPSGGSCVDNIYSYRWERSYDNVSWQELPNEAFAYYKGKDFQDRKTYFRRKVICGLESAYSNVVSIDIIPTLSAGKIGPEQVLAPGATPNAVSNLVAPSGGTGTYTYQWERSNDGLNWSILPGATGTAFAPTSLTSSSYFRRKVTAGSQVRYTNQLLITIRNTGVQNKPTAAAVGNSEPVQTIPDQSGINPASLNSVTQFNIMKPGVRNANDINSLSNIADFKKSTTYYDGMVRPVQTVHYKGALGIKDVVDVTLYDQFGRQPIKHLPYAASTTASNAGSFRTNSTTEQPAFYKNYTKQAEDYFYTQYKTEQSPLTRVEIKVDAGQGYAGKANGSATEYMVNNSEEDIRLWRVNDAEAALPYSDAMYPVSSLMITTRTNEQQQVVKEYKDLQGKVVLSTVRNNNAGSDQTLKTYYVYNDLGQLRFVLPPLASKFCEDNNVWDLSATEKARITARNLCFKYVYNLRGLVAKKRAPDADGEEYFIYDKKDRLVFSQTALMRARNNGEWLLYFYDELDRVKIKALYKNASATLESLQALIDQSSGNSTINNTIPATKDLYVDERNIGKQTYVATNSVLIQPGFDTEAGAEVDFYIDPALPAVNESIVINDAIPSLTGYEILNINYYDNYDWTGVKSFSSRFQTDAGSNAYAESVVPVTYPTGKLTGEKVRILDSNRFLSNTVYYDEKGRTIQTLQENINDGVDVTTTQYNFAGQQLSVHHRQKHPGSEYQEVQHLTAYTYGQMGELTTVTHKVTDHKGVVQPTKTISSYTYDELGSVKTKSLGGLETLEYEYTLNGQLAAINREYARSAAGGHYFGMEISYDKGFEVPRMDGNAAGVTWRRKGNPDEWHAYGYSYDAAGRMVKADYTQNSGNTWTSDNADYKVAVPAYDANGNIQQMKQDGMLPGNVKAGLDDLSYSYYDTDGWSNRLKSVTDTKGNQQQGDFKDVNDGSADYEYDANGNMIKDKNRDIVVVYDFLLNKPKKISFISDPNKSITYTYDADGFKLQQTVVDGSNTNTYTYVHGYVYQNNKLLYFPHDAGRVRINADGKYLYDYFIADYLGNNRTVITEETNLLAYRATHEDNPQPAPVVPERELFNFPVQTEDIPSTHKLYDYEGTNRKFVKLNADNPDKKIGTSKVLRVMAGDQVETSVLSQYAQNSPQNNTPNVPLDEILNQLIAVMLGPNPAVINNGKGNIVQSTTNGITLNKEDFKSFINNNQQNNPSTTTPKAYLNYVLFDDNFKMVGGGTKRVSQPDQVERLEGAINVNKNGYLYIYVSNESPTNVYFDNLFVKHVTGHLLQEDSYYPFGLTIKSLSSSALNRQRNNYLFNGIESTADLDINIADAFYRNLDPQTGRWWQRDTKMDDYLSLSPYHVNGNNPVNFSDPLGDDWFGNMSYLFSQMGPGDPPSKGFRDFIKAMKNQKVGAKLGEAADAFSKVFVGGVNLKLKVWGIGAGFKAGPFAANAKVAVLETTFAVKTDNTSVVSTSLLNFSADAQAATNKVEGTLEIMKGTRTRDLSTGHSVDEFKNFNAEGKIGRNNFTLNNSLDFGTTGKLGPVEGEVTVSPVNFVKGLIGLAEAANEYAKSIIEEMTKRAPELRRKGIIEIGKLSIIGIKEETKK